MFHALFAFVAAAPVATPKPLPTTASDFQFQQVTFGSTHPLLLGIVQWLFIACALGLVGLMSMQTTKNEGLSGSIGGRSESAYRGRLGLDQQLARLTSGFAIAFVFLAIAYFLVTR
ncbi:MAG: preprotein translocase subunit SecG [Candidatus Eremiobacteraeota bacterium]|nr:preprotein translocase subunit SecG [Candidatus Eremiobacteraeota bacterium]MBV8204855.1 preprotein translocase subunit SecG [Candidatus Eremiobacteraeota bacterium]MBV8264541.1 preprotein translocase subunit SecG [Candidatus Eremiobacteraeota bacterium]MBV8338495.1 preprotein translocase subunit SecG [Candidatus Eremiobacteraeota bacterium]MBV8459982.1 preprotein translocase subunit SecG [Candidatus Eremiobacteraeota bacterium]